MFQRVEMVRKGRHVKHEGIERVPGGGEGWTGVGVLRAVAGEL